MNKFIVDIIGLFSVIGVVLIGCAYIVVVIALFVPVFPLILLAMPAMVLTDIERGSHRHEKGWRKVTTAPYLAYHKFIVEKLFRSKQQLT